jgi:hypothetical protein
MNTLVKNTKSNNLVNYSCSSNSSISQSVIVNTSDINSQASLFKNNLRVEYHILPEDPIKVIDTPKLLE